jgi:DNA ligase (NAD+)
VKTSKEAVWRCVNFDCPALARGRIIHFASKAAMDIEGLGESTVDALLDAKLIADPADLFALTKDQLLEVDRFAAVSAAKLASAIAASRTPELGRFIFGLGIRHVGFQTARDLATAFGSLASFEHATNADINAVPGIGPVVAASINDWLQSERHQALLRKFESLGVQPVAIERTVGPLTGKTYVITGTLELGSRDEVAARLEALGATVKDAVTKDTTAVIVGENPGGSKIARAEKLGIELVDESQLNALLS